MTIEQNIERIANALEALVQIAGGKTTAPITTAAPVASAAPGVVLPSMPTPPPAAAVSAPVGGPDQVAEAIPANSEQLRALAASIAQDLGKDAKTASKVLVFTNWVSTMLQPYGVAKLVDVRPEHIPAAAREIYGWARKEGINV